MSRHSLHVVAALERERQERMERASGLPYGLTVTEFARRWTVSEQQAADFLRHFVELGFAVKSDGRYYATVKALRLNLPVDEVVA